MTAKQFLKQYLDAEQSIKAKLEEIHRLRMLAENTTHTFGGERVQTSGTGDSLERIVAKIADMEHEVDVEIDKLQEIKENVRSTIMSVEDDKLRTLLEHRYINGRKWEEIAVEMKLDYRWILRLHGKALSKIEIDHRKPHSIYGIV